MADVTKSIGTASRDYSTIELWEADLDDSGIYSSGDVAIGQCYNDSVFSPSASITINGGGTIGLTSRTLEAASGEIHDGTEGSGARVVYGGDQIIIVAIPTLIRGLELSGNDADSGSVNSAAIRASATALDVRRCLLHSFLVSNAHCRAVTMEAEAGIMVRCFIYSVTCTSTNTNHHADSVFYFGTPTAAGLWLNITNLRVTRDNANGRSHCYSFPDDSNVTIRNCLGFLSNAGSSTLNGDYRRSSPSNAVVNHVGASDTTASGTNSIDSMTPGDELVSTVAGSENLHLKTGGQAIDAGVDLATTPAGVNIDIDGRDVDAEADTWDMGAHEFIALASTPFTRSVMVQQSVHRSNYY